jgi:hypothetical protein
MAIFSYANSDESWAGSIQTIKPKFFTLLATIPRVAPHSPLARRFDGLGKTENAPFIQLNQCEMADSSGEVHR